MIVIDGHCAAPGQLKLTQQLGLRRHSRRCQEWQVIDVD
jgi:hypothetical protein